MGFPKTFKQLSGISDHQTAYQVIIKRHTRSPGSTPGHQAMHQVTRLQGGTPAHQPAH